MPGFLRVELEMNEQKRRINALENVADPEAPSSDPDGVIKIIENAQGRLMFMYEQFTENVSLGLQGISFVI